MESETTKAAGSDLTWSRVWKWVGILYVATLVAVLIKTSAQGLEFQNIWQYMAVAALPVIYMFWFAAVGFVYLAFKRFRVGNATGFLRFLAIVYVIFVAIRLMLGGTI